MSEALVINDVITIPVGELEWTAARASGPGGQHVNKVSSKVELRYDLARSAVLDEATRARLRTLARSRLDADGRILVTSQRTRDQSRNLEDAREKLRALVLAALVAPRPRRPTRPSRAVNERRIAAKRAQSERKRDRRSPTDD